MGATQGEPEFNQARAEVFEALGHPVRIRLLQTLERGPVGFAELKKAVGIDSSGHLSFHLGKLEGLLRTDQDGRYSLTDEGREALRIISATREEGSGGIVVRVPRLPSRNAALAALVVGLLVMASLAVYQQQQIDGLNQSITAQQAGTVSINGTRYSYLDIPWQSLDFPATIHFDGVTFSLTGPPSAGTFSISPPNETVSITAVSSGQPGVPLQQGNLTGTLVSVRIYPVWGRIQVTFADGRQETYGMAGATTNQTGVVYFSTQPMPNPWLSLHTGPQAGVFWNLTAGSVELLVSVGT